MDATNTLYDGVGTSVAVRFQPVIPCGASIPGAMVASRTVSYDRSDYDLYLRFAVH